MRVTARIENTPLFLYPATPTRGAITLRILLDRQAVGAVRETRNKIEAPPQPAPL